MECAYDFASLNGIDFPWMRPHFGFARVSSPSSLKTGLKLPRNNPTQNVVTTFGLKPQNTQGF